MRLRTITLDAPALRATLRLTTIGGVYLLAAKVGLSMAFAAEQVSLVWPPTGIALVSVQWGGSRVWPAIWVGAFVANATGHEPLMVAAAIAVGNTLEALTGAWLLRRLVGIDQSFERFMPTLGLIVYGALVSTIVSATIGATSLCLGGVQPWNSYVSLWSTWWLGDAMGDLLVAPVLLT